MEGKTQETAAAQAGMSVRSARKRQSGLLPSATKPEHRWRTRPDPFDGVWEDEIDPLPRGDPAGKLKATTIIDWLEEQHPGRFSAAGRRTLQRRLQDWRSLHRPEREVYFPQEHPPGREAQIDFTHCGELEVTIAGQPYRHLLFQLILSHSGWRYAEVAAGETFLAFAAGIAECPLDPLTGVCIGFSCRGMAGDLQVGLGFRPGFGQQPYPALEPAPVRQSPQPGDTVDLTRIGMGFPDFAPAAPLHGLSASGFAIPSPQPIKESLAGVRAGKGRRLEVNRRRDANKLGRCCG